MKKIILPILGLLFLNACEKANVATVSPDYYPLSTGNYWVYDWEISDSLGNNTHYVKRDSFVIAGDTTINGIQYYKRHLYHMNYDGTYPFPPIEDYIKNDHGDIVKLDGCVILSFRTPRVDTTQIYNYPTRYLVNNSIVPVPNQTTNITVPVGSFQAIEEVTTVDKYFDGNHEILPHTYQYFADGIGEIYQKCYTLSDPYNRKTHKRLVNYHVAP